MGGSGSMMRTVCECGHGSGRHGIGYLVVKRNDDHCRWGWSMYPTGEWYMLGYDACKCLGYVEAASSRKPPPKARTITLSGEPVLRVKMARISTNVTSGVAEPLRRVLRDGNLILITELGYSRAYEVVSREEERP